MAQMQILHQTNTVDNSRTSIDRLREVKKRAPDEMGSLSEPLRVPQGGGR